MSEPFCEKSSSPSCGPIITDFPCELSQTPPVRDGETPTHETPSSKPKVKESLSIPPILTPGMLDMVRSTGSLLLRLSMAGAVTNSTHDAKFYIKASSENIDLIVFKLADRRDLEMNLQKIKPLILTMVCNTLSWELKEE